MSFEDRFWSKVVQGSSGCLLWVGSVVGNGYGQIWRNGKLQIAHRALWEHLGNSIPVGWELDHLCRVRNCVNPRHLEVVTHAENMARSDITVVQIQAAKTHCPHGHEYTQENTRFCKRVSKAGTPSVSRVCRECERVFGRGTRPMVEKA